MTVQALEYSKTLEHNKDVVRRWIEEVFNNKNLDAVEDLKVLSYLDWTPFPKQRLDLPISGLKQSLPVFFASLPDFHFTADEMIAEGDLVVCLGSWNATNTGEYMGVAPTGKRVTGTRIDIFRITGDKMAEHWGCGGELSMLRVMGALPVADQTEVAEPGPKAIAREFMEKVFNQRNLAAIDELIDDHAIDHGNQALSSFFILTAFPDFQVNIEHMIAEDDKVTVLSTFSGTHKGEFMGIPATGKRVEGTRTDILRIANGKIVESWQDWDQTSLVQQLKD
ncbi:MAG TPA: ester cyclase [Herpetosiphonaceae bacterium]